MADVIQRPAPVNLRLYRSDTTRLRLTVRDKATGAPLVLDGTVAAQVRASVGAVDSLADLTVIDLDADAGTVTLGLDTTALPARCSWDVEWTAADGRVTTLVAGLVQIAGDYTRPASP